MSNVLRGVITNPDTIYGKSAYEIAVKHGFDGTEEEWLNSLKYNGLYVTPDVKDGDINPVSSDAVYHAIEKAKVTVSTEIKEGDKNPISSDAVYKAFAEIGDALASI